MLSSAELKNHLATFGKCKLDCNSGYLAVSGVQQNLEPLVFQFLLLLIRQQGEVVSKKSVFENCWPDRSPTDEALRAMVKKAREALKDDARNPSYIKTIPTKGYLLIPNVELSSTIIQSWLKKNKNRNKKRLFLIGLLVTLAGILVNMVFFGEKSAEELAAEIRVTKTEIGRLNGFEVSTHYVNDRLKNVYKKRNSNKRINTLIIEDIANKQQLNVVFSNAEVGDFWWSKYSNRLLVTRSDSPGFYIIQFKKIRDQVSKEPSITLQNFALPSEYRIIALNHSGTQIFVSRKTSGHISRFDLDSGELKLVVSLNSLLTRPQDKMQSDLDMLTTPAFLDSTLATQNLLREENEAKGQIIDIWPSPTTTQYIAVVQYRTHANLVLLDDQAHDRIVDQQLVPSGIRGGVWDKEGKKFSFTDELGALFSYQVAQSKITSWNTGGVLVNGLIADCGDSCFIVANTQGLPKLATLSNPFNPSNSYAQVIASNRQTRNESLPFLTHNGIYFIAQFQAGYNLMFRGHDDAESIIYGFGSQNKVSEFVISEDQEMMIGLLNDRPFSLNLMSQKFRYLNISYPDVGQFMFDNSTNLTFYANPPNQASGRYSYDLKNNQIVLVAVGLVIDYPIVLDGSAQGTLDGSVTAVSGVMSADRSNRIRARFQVDGNNTASIVFRGDKDPLVLGQFEHNCASCFHINNNYLYYIDDQNFPSLARINLITAQRTQISLGLPDVTRHFSLSPNGKLMALTMRQNLQTNLVKIEGFTQVY